VEAGSEVGVAFDPMLAKVIAHAPTRAEAALRLALALERATIAGVVTNRELLVTALRHPDFLAGDTTTNFIDRLGLGAAGRPPELHQLAPLLAALVLWRQHAIRAAAPVLGFLPSGYRNSVMPPERLTCTTGELEVTVAYRRQRTGLFTVELAAGPIGGPPEGRAVTQLEAVLDSVKKHEVEARIDGVRARYVVVAQGDRWHVQGPTGRADLVELSPFPRAGLEQVVGGQAAPMPGSIRVVAVRVGQEVAAGQMLVVMEAMKMEHTITAPEAAVVSEVRCAVGDQVDNGQVLVVLEPVSGPGQATEAP
jgi:propionyl-CoA carboxylase alpha chain